MKDAFSVNTTLSTTNDITISHIFYNQHAILPLHFEAWSKHPIQAVRYTLIDDNSPRPLVRSPHATHADIYRILDPIAWNTSGARNLAFHVARTPWVLCADIDHIVTLDALTRILTLDLSNRNTAYTFSRRRPDGRWGVPYPHNILMHRHRYFEVGGTDEDFAGHYAVEDTFFGRCLAYHNVNVTHCGDIVLDWRPRLGSTGGLNRDKTVNRTRYGTKYRSLLAGSYATGPILRFKWQQVQSGSQ